MDIWQACREKIAVVRLRGSIWRIVESQEQVATNSLVDSFDEQALLEDMLEQSKPPAPVGTAGLDYLLATPFRYPPLRYGSRFGDRFSPSLFYGSRKPYTALAECAYYRFLFWYGMKTPPLSGRFVTAHTLFSAKLDSSHGTRLQQPPFDEYRQQLVDPASYQYTQPLGEQLRNAGIDCFEYLSARGSSQRGSSQRKSDSCINIALFNAKPFAGRKPETQQHWLCETTSGTVKFSSANGQRESFPLMQYLVNGELPYPG